MIEDRWPALNSHSVNVQSATAKDSPAVLSQTGLISWAKSRAYRLINSSSSYLLFAVPFIIGMTVPLWTGLHPYFLFGQDSTALVHPFVFSNNPLLQYNYLFLWSFPIPDEAPYFLFSTLVQALEDLIPSVVVVQQIALFALVVAAGFGVLYLLRVLNAAFGTDARPITFWIAILCVSIYVMNPFSLSVIWWRVEGWTFLYAFAPFFVALMFEFAWLPHPSIRNAIGVVALGLFLSPGVVGGFSIVLGYVIVFASAVIVTRLMWRKIKISSFALRLTAIWTAFLALELYFLIPYVSIPGYAFSSTSYITYANLQTQYVNVSTEATLVNVLGLSGTNWLTLSRVESSFPWLGVSSLLAALSLVLLALSTTSLLKPGRRRRIAMTILLFMVVPVVWATGSNFPLSSAKFYLLSLRGPFLALVGGYYFVETLYVIALVSLGFVALSNARDWLSSRSKGNAPPRSDSDVEASRSWVAPPFRPLRRRTRAHLSLNGQRVAGISVVVVMMVIGTGFIYPFVTGQVYKVAGPNSDAFVLPESFAELSNFFEQNYSGPYYYALLIPLSSSAGLPLNIGPAKLLDTSGLIAQHIPYPLIWINNSALSSALDSLFSLGSAVNYTLVLSALHIRYVVFNPYANISAPAIAQAGNGRSINWSAVVNTLRSTLPSVPVGRFSVFVNLGASRLASAASEISSFVDPSLLDYLTTLSRIRDAPDGPAGQLASAVWAPEPVAGIPSSIELGPPSAPSANYSIPPGSVPYLVSTDGSLVTPENASRAGIIGVAYTPNTHALTIASPPICTLTMNSCKITSSFELRNGTYYNPINQTSQLTFPSAESNGTLLYGTFKVEALSEQNWLTVALVNQTVQLEIQIYANSSLGVYILSLAIMNSAGVDYAWNNVGFPTSVLPGLVNLTVEVGPSTVTAELDSVSQRKVAATDLLYYQPDKVTQNGGYNLSAVPPSNVTIGNRILQLTATYAEVATIFLGEYRATHLSQILELPVMSQPSPTLPSSLSSTITGNIQMSITQSSVRSASYIVLAYPANSLWVATSPGCTLQPVPGFPLANVYAITGCGVGTNNLEVTLTFNVSLDIGLFVGAVVFAVCSVAFIGIPVYRRVKYAIRDRCRSI